MTEVGWQRMKKYKWDAVRFRVRGTFEGYLRKLIWTWQWEISRKMFQDREGREVQRGEGKIEWRGKHWGDQVNKTHTLGELWEGPS